jgi:DNA mismatch endonuclease (patch repair protein)
MARVRSRGNATTELRFIALLRSKGIKGWRRYLPLVGKPDFVFPSARLAVFIDGCFWHGHDCGRNLRPNTNQHAWSQKIDKNRQRDLTVTAHLKLQGWTVIRIWECSLKSNPQGSLQKVTKHLEKFAIR